MIWKWNVPEESASHDTWNSVGTKDETIPKAEEAKETYSRLQRRQALRELFVRMQERRAEWRKRSGWE